MVFHHCFWSSKLYEGYQVSFIPFAEQTIVNIAGAGKICVSIFAFISGYGLYLNYGSADKQQFDGETGKATLWTLHRYIATFSGYWFVWILSTILTQLINERAEKVFLGDGLYRGFIYLTLDFFGLAKLFETPSLNNDWWYMSAAIVFIALVPLLYRLRKNILLILLWVVLFLRVIHGHNGEGVFTGWTSIYVFIPIFIMGFIFAHYRLFDRIAGICRNEKLWMRILILICLCWILLLLYKMYFNTPISLFWEIHYALFPVILIVLCVEYIIPIMAIKRILAFFGKHASNIYFVHAFIRTYCLHDITYSRGHFLLVYSFLLFTSLGISLLLEWMKTILNYNSLLERLSEILRAN